MHMSQTSDDQTMFSSSKSLPEIRVHDKKSAFPESLTIYVRSTSVNRVEILYLHICCVMSINSEMNLAISI